VSREKQHVTDGCDVCARACVRARARARVCVCVCVCVSVCMCVLIMVEVVVGVGHPGRREAVEGTPTGMYCTDLFELCFFHHAPPRCKLRLEFWSEACHTCAGAWS
jgi:hypothetical protein